MNLHRIPVTRWLNLYAILGLFAFIATFLIGIPQSPSNLLRLVFWSGLACSVAATAFVIRHSAAKADRYLAISTSLGYAFAIFGPVALIAALGFPSPD